MVPLFWFWFFWQPCEIGADGAVVLVLVMGTMWDSGSVVLILVMAGNHVAKQLGHPSFGN
jgi:hypothetical protein